MKYLKNTAKILFFLTVFVVIACGNVGLFLPVENEEPAVSITSVTKGAVLMPEDTFEVSVDFNREEYFPDRMVIDLRDSGGEVLFSVELDQDGIYELPLPVALPPDLDDGVYEVGVTVFQEGEEIASSEALFFFVTEEYQIRAITAYPQIFYPGGKGLVIADLDIPENSNPYLRWSAEGTEIYAGPLMNGADRLQLDVPDREGVYSIRLEIFPFEPGGFYGGSGESETAEGEGVPGYDFFSFISLEAQFFVSKTQGGSEGELGPERDYYSLFHFRGEAVDWGYRGTGNIASPVGTPILDITRGVFGFRFDGSDGFTVDELLLPVEDGYVQPFSYSARFVIDAHEGIVTAMRDGRNAPVFSMGFLDGKLTATLLGTSSSVERLFYEEVGAELTLTVLPGDGEIRYLWFVDGVLLGDDRASYEPVQIAPGGLTVIGGAGGMLGIVDELGVYYRLTDAGPETDADVFLRAMERSYGDDLVFAEGFDGTVLPDQVVFSGEEESYTLDGGSLFLPAGTSIAFPSIGLDFDSLVMEIALSGESREDGGTAEAGGQAGIVLRESSDDTPLYDLSGDVVELQDDSILTVTIGVTDNGFVAAHGEKTYPIGTIKDGIDLLIENRGENGELEIKSLLIFKNRTQSNTETPH
ncbi:MAG: hypothetical protein JW852_09035 [Spirochaetales bacterium]|nr:hypothetical protein [Spirochaetales bacterium]